MAADPFQRAHSGHGPSKALINLVTEWEVSSENTGGIISPAESIITTATSSYGIPSNPFTTSSATVLDDDSAEYSEGGGLNGSGTPLSRALSNQVAAVRYKGKVMDRKRFEVWRIDGVIIDPKPGFSSWSGRFTTIVNDMARFAGDDGFFTITGADKSRFEQKISNKQAQRSDGSWIWKTRVFQQDNTSNFPNWTTVINMERKYLSTQFPTHLGSRDFTWIQGTDPDGSLFSLYEAHGTNWSRISKDKRMFRDVPLRGPDETFIAATRVPAAVSEMDWVLEVHLPHTPTSAVASEPPSNAASASASAAAAAAVYGHKEVYATRPVTAGSSEETDDTTASTASERDDQRKVGMANGGMPSIDGRRVHMSGTI
ncbi:hypothetical protein MKZ38_003153 [Zalerion maritima]|uniref:Uncharacterized protein n=1 Tax=Zalerion maritima TaxID=339359 RepID=A0AAD5S6J4_9PEZI|nr:hypothetical protein MKZ38_003153 [Zalerion maritima]